MKHLRTSFVLMLLGLAACGSAPVVEPPPPPVTIEASVAAAADANPDAAGRASPLVVRLYELTDAEAFGGADFFALWNQEAPVLAAALVKRHEIVVAPGAHSSRTLTLDPKVRALGVAAAFRDIRNANWRTVVAIPAPGSGTLKLDVVATGTRLTATTGQDSAAPAAGTERKKKE